MFKGDSLSDNVGVKFNIGYFIDLGYIGGASSCALNHKNGWWIRSVRTCSKSNLNGWYLRGHKPHRFLGIIWVTWKGVEHSLKSVEMKLRPYEPSSKPKPRDCREIRKSRLERKYLWSGVYTVYVGSEQRPLQVYCEMDMPSRINTRKYWTVCIKTCCDPVMFRVEFDLSKLTEIGFELGGFILSYT